MYYSTHFPEHEKAANPTTKVRHATSGLSKFDEARALNSLVLEDAASKTAAMQQQRAERERAADSARLRQREREETERIVESAAAYKTSISGVWREDTYDSRRGQLEPPFIATDAVDRVADLNAEIIRGTEKLRAADNAAKASKGKSFFLAAEEIDNVAAQNEHFFHQLSVLGVLREAREREKLRREAWEDAQKRGAVRMVGAEEVAQFNAQIEKLAEQRQSKAEATHRAEQQARFTHVAQLREGTERIKEKRLAAEHEDEKRWSS